MRTREGAVSRAKDSRVARACVDVRADTRVPTCSHGRWGWSGDSRYGEMYAGVRGAARNTAAGRRKQGNPTCFDPDTLLTVVGLFARQQDNALQAGPGRTRTH